MLRRKTFYFLRHGQTDWNLAKRIQGQADIPLNDSGRLQARAVAKLVAELDIGSIFTSSLSRAYETAQIVKAKQNLQVSVIEELKEVTIGVRDGDQRGEWYQRWKAGDIVISGAESRADFRQRIAVGINKVLAYPDTALIVSHGGVYSALKEAINIYPEVALENCMLLKLTPDPDNDTQWLVTVLSEADCDD